MIAIAAFGVAALSFFQLPVALLLHPFKLASIKFLPLALLLSSALHFPLKLALPLLSLESFLSLF